MRWLRRSRSLLSIACGVLPGTPNTRTEACILCCLRRSSTSRRSPSIYPSLRATVACRAPTACSRSCTACCNAVVTRSNLLSIAGCRISRKRSTFESSSRVDKSDLVKPSNFVACWVVRSRPSLVSIHRPQKVYERFCLPRIRPLRCDYFNKSLSENPYM